MTGEYKLFAGDAPDIPGVILYECNGQSIERTADNTGLAAYLGFAPDVENFTVPDMRGRVFIGAGIEELGVEGGAATVQLTTAEIPQHNHTLFASSRQGSSAYAEGNVLASSIIDRSTGETVDAEFTTPENFIPVALHAGSVGDVGQTQAHDNMQPYRTARIYIEA